MKKSIFNYTAFCYWSIAICIVFCLGCKKSKGPNPFTETKISFTYNGHDYGGGAPSRIETNLIIVQNEILIVNFAGLTLDDNALFGGVIYISALTPGTPCAWLQPTGLSVVPVLGNCNNLQTAGGPIDSVRVYWYESGTINFSYSNCIPVTGAIVPGQRYCTVTGTFDLTLTNKNNLKIRLTNGSFTGTMRVYP